jgi:uncharacterized protein
MDEKEALAKAQAFAVGRLLGDVSGHDAFHLQRVKNLALAMAVEEGANPFITEMAAWLHDVVDTKLTDDPLTATEELHSFLVGLGLNEFDVDHIEKAARSTSFRDEIARETLGMVTLPLSLEAKVVRDADRLDALGAIGVARCFAFGGSRGRSLYAPGTEYEATSSLTHFTDKLLKLRDRMVTDSGRRRAEHRHQRIADFYSAFLEEWVGPD